MMAWLRSLLKEVIKIKHLNRRDGNDLLPGNDSRNPNLRYTSYCDFNSKDV